VARFAPGCAGYSTGVGSYWSLHAVTGKPAAAAKLPAKPYELKPAEQAVVDALRAKTDASRPSIRLTVKIEDGQWTISPDHLDKAVGHNLLCHALGTTSLAFAYGLIENLALATSGAKLNESAVNRMLATTTALEPQDPAEAMLITQMALVHEALSWAARRLAGADTLPQLDAHERCFNKLARTYAAQMETLKRYRTGGQQRVIVEHVTVNAGGQAIVGNVGHGGGGAPKKARATS
jgi:hypothetical protein